MLMAEFDSGTYGLFQILALMAALNQGFAILFAALINNEIKHSFTKIGSGEIDQDGSRP